MANLTPEQLASIKAKFDPTWNALFASPLAGDAPALAKLGRKLYNTDSARLRALSDAQNLVSKGMFEDEAISNVANLYSKASLSPFSAEGIGMGQLAELGADGAIKTQDIAKSPLSRTLGVGGEIIKSHPGQSLLAAGTTAGSLAGLFDNDKIGGQLVGTVAGAAIPAIAKMGLSPLTAYTVATGAGTLGSLFDKLREKKADERAAMANNPYGKEEYVR
jgi:hypothetical protein